MSCEIACVSGDSRLKRFLSLRKRATIEVYAADDPCVERLGDQVSRELVDKGNRRSFPEGALAAKVEGLVWYQKATLE